MHGQPAVISIRNDDEIARALEALGATEGTRTAVIRAAILAAAASHRRNQSPDPDQALHHIRQNLDEINRQLGIYLGVAA